MFLTPPLNALLLLTYILSSGWQLAAMPPMPQAYKSFWHVHGELITAALRAFFHHQRLRPFLLYTAVERVMCIYLWAPLAGVLSCVSRSLLAGVVSVLMCWALELYFRRRFVLAGLYS